MDTVYQRSQRQFCLLSIRDKIQLLRQNVLQHKMVDRNELTLAENAFLTQWKCNVKTAANRQIRPTRSTNQFVIIASVATLCIALAGIHLNGLIERITGVRCIMPNNYLIWEATRPESDCQFCSGIARPLILQNISRDDFYVSIANKMTRLNRSCGQCSEFSFYFCIFSNMHIRQDR